MRRNVLFGIFVVAVFALRLWAQEGDVGWSPVQVCYGGSMYSDLIGYGTLGLIGGVVHGIVRAMDTHARAKQRLNFAVLGL